MKTNIKKDLHAKSIAELEKSLKDAKVEMAKLSLDKEMGKITNTSQLRAGRAEIAVISTILNEKKAITASTSNVADANAAGAEAPAAAKAMAGEAEEKKDAVVKKKTVKEEKKEAVKTKTKTENKKGGKGD